MPIAEHEAMGDVRGAEEAIERAVRIGDRGVVSEAERHRLWPVLDATEALAQLTGLDWFSTELCLAEGPERSRFSVRPTAGAWGRVRWPVVAIDYVNDQCDVDPQSRWPGGPPDHVVRRVAERFAEAAWRCRQDSLRPAAAAPRREAA